MATSIDRKYVNKLSSAAVAAKRKPLKSLRCVSDQFDNYAWIAGLFELKKISKTHLIGLTAALQQLRKSESALGLFSDQFEECCMKAASYIGQRILPEAALAEKKLIQYWIELMVIGEVALLEMARKKDAAVSSDEEFRDELLLLLFFSSGFPKAVFREMSAGLGITGKSEKIFISMMRIIAFLTAVLAYSDAEGWFRPNNIDNLRPHLLRDLMILAEASDSAQSGPMRAYIEQMQLAIEKHDMPALKQTISDLLESNGYLPDNLKVDIGEMKGLFNQLKDAYQAAKETKTNVIHLVG